jgi:predicted SnoaL-like aldol condensation-catalyzing enzyme
MKKLILAAMLLAAVPLAPSHAQPAASETERNREVVTKFFDLFYNQKKVREAFETYVVPGYIQHNPIAQDGRDNAIAALEPFMKNVPGLKYEIKRIIVDGNLAAVHAHMKISPTDRGNAVIDIVRLENGKIVEHWDVIQVVPEKSANAHPMF